MKFKKLIITGIALLGLAGVSGISANASSQYAKRYMTVYRYYPSHAFYNRVNLNNYTHIHRGQKINVRPFYHMGHDGFIVHISGHRGTYYARTNSYNWYNAKRYKWIKIRKTKTVDGNGHFISGKSKFKRTNNKKALKRSGFVDFHNDVAFINKYAPTDKRARIPYKFNPYKHLMLWHVFSKSDWANNEWWWNKRSKRWVTSDIAPHKIHYTKWIKVAF